MEEVPVLQEQQTGRLLFSDSLLEESGTLGSIHVGQQGKTRITKKSTIQSPDSEGHQYLWERSPSKI